MVTETQMRAREIWEQSAPNAFQQPDKFVLDIIEDLRNIRNAARNLIEWCPVCSKGSSGYIRMRALRKLC